MSRADEVPDDMLINWYEEYVDEFEPDDDDDTPQSFEDWVSLNYSDMLSKYNELLQEYAADYALD